VVLVCWQLTNVVSWSVCFNFFVALVLLHTVRADDGRARSCHRLII